MTNKQQEEGKKTKQKQNMKQITIWIEEQIYTNEVMPQNYKHSGRFYALIKH